MNIAAPFTLTEKWRHIPNEYNIQYGEYSTLQKVIDFVEENLNKRINISFKKDIDFNILKTINKIHNQFYVRVMPHQLYTYKELNEKGFKFFCDIPCSTYQLLDFLLDINVTDIYPYDDLCYELPYIHKRCQEYDTNLRIVLNRIPSSSPNAATDYRTPVFSPRDMEILEECIDTVEFDCWIDENNYNWHKFNVLYEVWFKDKDWFGDLQEINDDLGFSIPVYSLVPSFAQRRLSCGRKCSYNWACKRCEDIITTTQDLAVQGLYVKLLGKKEKETND